MKRIRCFYEGRTVCGVLDGTYVLTSSGERIPETEIKDWLVPLKPNNMLVAALNYQGVFEEQQLEKPLTDPVIFQKFNTTLTGHRGEVIFPEGAEDLVCENELLVVIGKSGRKISRENAFNYVAGYTIGNDLTIASRMPKQHGRPPLKAKQYDTFGPVGPWLVDKEDVADAQALELRTYVNGELKQKGNTSEMLFDISYLIAYISQYMTLSPGDIIWTGTPCGVVRVKPGDVMRLEIEGLGALENVIVKE